MFSMLMFKFEQSCRNSAIHFRTCKVLYDKLGLESRKLMRSTVCGITWKSSRAGEVPGARTSSLKKRRNVETIQNRLKNSYEIFELGKISIIISAFDSLHRFVLAGRRVYARRQPEVKQSIKYRPRAILLPPSWPRPHWRKSNWAWPTVGLSAGTVRAQACCRWKRRKTQSDGTRRCCRTEIGRTRA